MLSSEEFGKLKEGGLMAVYKPKGWTSQDVVGKIKTTLQKSVNRSIKIKVGHGGTLDPMATGVLVIGIGNGCKELHNYLKGDKSYEAIGRFGLSTTTEDAEGDIVSEQSWDHISSKMIKNVLPQFQGDIMQIPPMYSALKKDGVRLYKLAREGEIIERKPRQIHISELSLLPKVKDMLLSDFRIRIKCGGGTYIRTLITDIASKLGTVAHMISLLRISQGPFTIDNCLREKDFDNANLLISHLSNSQQIYKQTPVKKMTIKNGSKQTNKKSKTKRIDTKTQL